MRGVKAAQLIMEYRYKVEKGNVVSRLFVDKIPKGWHESPDAARIAAGMPSKYSKPINTSKAASDLAKKHNIDLNQVIGSGKDGAIIKGDIVKLIG